MEEITGEVRPFTVAFTVSSTRTFATLRPLAQLHRFDDPWREIPRHHPVPPLCRSALAGGLQVFALLPGAQHGERCPDLRCGHLHVHRLDNGFAHVPVQLVHLMWLDGWPNRDFSKPKNSSKTP